MWIHTTKQISRLALHNVPNEQIYTPSKWSDPIKVSWDNKPKELQIHDECEHPYF